MTVSIKRLGVLVVDDNVNMRRLIHGMLMELSLHQTFQAKDGVEALRFMGDCEEMVDVILCDWNMPRMTGLDLLRQIRSVDPNIPFVMVTGRLNQQSILEAKNFGVTDYLAKPFSTTDLAKKLRRLARLLDARKATTVR